jgi:Escherichia/Staphylococcus phage prohead protease
MSKKPETNKLERRMYVTEFRAVKQDNQPTKLVGYAAVFDQPADLGYFTEVVKPGAFTRTLREGADVRALFNHDPNYVLGRSKDGGKTGTLSLAEDATGLKFEVEMPDTQVARDLMTLVDRGDVAECSFGFIVREQNWNAVTDADGDTQEIREILDVDLLDVSAVTYPAYSGTSVEARSKFMFPDGAPERRAEQPTATEQAKTEPDLDTAAIDCMRMRIRIALL